MDSTPDLLSSNVLDPILYPLPIASATAPAALLKDFRQRLPRTTWASQTPDTLMAPVWSAASSVAHFEARLLALFRAHLKILHALQTETSREGSWRQYADLLKIVRTYNRWPVLGEGEPLPADSLVSPDAARLLYGRPDIVLGEAGPMVVETNFDTGLGGYTRPDDIWAIAAELFAPPADFLVTGRPLDGFAAYFAELADGSPCDIHWIMKNDDAVRRELAPVLNRLNRHTTGVEHIIHYAGEPVPPLRGDRTAWLHRACSIYSVNRDREHFATLLTELMPLVRGCTVPVWLSVLDSKLFLAWLSDPAARPASLSAEECEAVESLLPWTRVLSLLQGEELEQVRRNRADFILKKSDSFQAKEVHFGCNLSSQAWTDLLEQRRMQPAWMDETANIWIVQKRVRPRAYDLIEYTDAGPVERRTGVSCCPYLLGGKLRGLETWVTPFTPDMSMIHRMQFVPHFIRPGV
ncbi:hypothetical protein [Dyella tabacisoli]|uniref:Glutathionylspermidine synthase pre-ATP-grasp-like domain-containing protein n=1 Tax=Dyella tabacisoli TaxID=2282381 RepID=A0A369UQR3_9GAMM|nr:hypothetical protein [Dyella tabacisoli]RDD83104.1 hypothetical protein DVJ77_00335 [Dyella tabacisoli]